MLAGKTVVLGISGGIAAYQAMEITGQLRSRLADVYIIMTRAATKFITPLSLETVSLHPVVLDMFDEPRQWLVPHISLAQRADIFLVAPATANIIGKIANGIADDMLSTTVMATKAPVVIAPAMNENMWLNPIVQGNVDKLKKTGYQIIDPEYGPMACGGEGVGRMARVESILSKLFEISKTIEVERTSGPEADNPKIESGGGE